MMEHIAGFLVLTVATYYDLKSYRIPNAWILAGYGIGLILAICSGGMSGLLHAVLRAAMPILALYVLFFIRALGAGDLKLLSCMATMCSTTEEVWNLILLSFVIGAAIGLIRLLLSGQLFVQISNFVTYITQCAISRSIEAYTTVAGKKSYLHFGGCILLAYGVMTLREVLV